MGRPQAHQHLPTCTPSLLPAAAAGLPRQPQLSSPSLRLRALDLLPSGPTPGLQPCRGAPRHLPLLVLLSWQAQNLLFSALDALLGSRIGNEQPAEVLAGATNSQLRAGGDLSLEAEGEALIDARVVNEVMAEAAGAAASFVLASNLHSSNTVLSDVYYSRTCVMSSVLTRRYSVGTTSGMV